MLNSAAKISTAAATDLKQIGFAVREQIRESNTGQNTGQRATSADVTNVFTLVRIVTA